VGYVPPCPMRASIAVRAEQLIASLAPRSGAVGLGGATGTEQAVGRINPGPHRPTAGNHSGGAQALPTYPTFRLLQVSVLGT
jgi:hypothetical protein